MLPTLRERHPRVELEIVTDGRFVDIVAAGFDAGVRLGEAVPRDMVAVRLGGAVRFLAVASPDYLDRRGRPESPEALRGHECIRQRLPSGKPYRWELERDGRTIAVDVPGALTLDHPPLMAEAAAAGLGIAFVTDTVAAEALAAGRLEPVLADWCPPGPGLHLYWPGHRQVPPALRALVDVARECLSAEADGRDRHAALRPGSP